MTFIGMAVAITAPFLVLFTTEVHGITSTQHGIFLAMIALMSFLVNSVVGRLSDKIPQYRNIIILCSLLCFVFAFMNYLLISNTLMMIILVILFQGLGAPAMPQLYAIAREGINESHSDRAVLANTVLRSMFSFGFLMGPLVGTILLMKFDYDGLFIGTILLFLVVFISCLFVKKPNTQFHYSTTSHIKPEAPNMFKTKEILLPFIAFVLLHIGQWMYLLNMPLYVKNYLNESAREVGWLSSLCAGLEVPIMILLGMLASRLKTMTLLKIGAVVGAIFFISIGIFESVYAMLIGQIALAFFISVLLGLGISFFQDLLPDFPGYASTLFSNAMIVGQFVGNLLGGAMSEWVGLGYVFYVSGSFLIVAFIILLFSKEEVRV